MRKNLTKILVVSLLACSLVFAGCSNKNSGSSSTPVTPSTNESSTPSSEAEVLDITLPQLEDPKEGQDKAVIKTSMGDITVVFYPEYAPKAVENFLTHAKNGYYDGITFHRVISDFMIQGGDPEGTGRGGESIWGKAFEDEFAVELSHFKGALSMANSGANTNGSQFFIVSNKNLDPELASQMASAGWPEEIIEGYKTLGGTPWLDGKHTVFGQVIDGFDVLEVIDAAETGASDAPKTPITINSIEVTKVGQ